MKKLKYLLIIIMLVGTMVITVVNVSQNELGRVVTNSLIFPTILLPIIFHKTKFELTDNELLLYYIFVFIAQFLGSIVNLYKYIWWFDLFSHFLSGVFSYILSIFLLKRLGVYNPKNKLFNFLFSFGIIFFVAGGWEMIEFTVDTIFHTNLQHALDTGIADTMEDMIIAFFGGLGAFYLSKNY